MSLFYLFIVLYLVMTLATITTNINSIPMLNGSNFESQLDNFLIVLVVMDLDLTLRVDSLPSFSDESTFDVKKDLEGWEK